MDSTQRNILYNPRRAIEHIEKLPGLTPIRLFAVLFPLWYVEVSGTQELQRPYELIENYIERGIAEGQLRTISALADFFSLDSRLVEKILFFLETIGHATHTRDTWALTQLGERSLEAGKKIIAQQKAQKLYFEAFRSQPLQRVHYGNNLQTYADAEADEITPIYKGYKFHRMYSFPDWQPESLQRLEQQPDRAQYNLPTGIHNLQFLSRVQVYFPMYIIETRKQNHQPYYVAYTHIQGRRDSYFEHIVNSYPEIQRSLAAEKEMKASELWRKWLLKKGITSVQPEQLPSGIWRINLVEAAFHASTDSLSIADIGTYRLEDGYFLQIWCSDIFLRRQAALDRTLKIIEKRQEIYHSGRG